MNPQGRTWRVSRRWLPWRRRVKVDSAPDLPANGGLGDDPISMIIWAVLFVFVIPLVLVLGVALLELLALLLLLPFVALGRAIFGQAWRIEVREGWKPVWDAEAGSWSESGRAIETVADGLRQGLEPQEATAPLQIDQPA